MRFEGPRRSPMPWVILLIVVVIAAAAVYFLFLAPR
jgi:hypothetical protein